MTQIIQTISNHPVLDKPRAIRLKQLAYIDFDIFEGQVTWEELFLDAEGNPIIDPTVARRKIVSHVSNANTVTDQGIVIDSENFPQNEGESDEDYQARLQALKDAGFPEFDFYVGAVINTPAIAQAIAVLDSLGRFNKE